MTNLRKYIFRFFISALSIFFALLFIEVSVRILGRAGIISIPPPGIPIFSNLPRGCVDSKSEPYRLVPGFRGTMISPRGDFIAGFSINDSGYRGVLSSLENKPRIALYGCSFTFGEGVLDTETIAARLEEMMRTLPEYKSAAVMNMGVSGYSAKQMKELADCSISELKPDTIIFVIPSAGMWRLSAPFKVFSGHIFFANVYPGLVEYNGIICHSNYSGLLKKIHVFLQVHSSLFRYSRNKNIFAFFRKKTDSVAANGEQISKRIFTRDTQSQSLLLDVMKEMLAMESDTLNVRILLFGPNYELLNEAIEKPPFLGKILYVPFSEDTPDTEYSFPRDGHWNAQGHKKMAEILFKTLFRKNVN